MNDSATPRERASAFGSQLDSDAARVAHAAAELGVPVPRMFRLVGVGEDGGQRVSVGGTAQDFRHGIAILARLDGKPVDECLAEMDAPRGEWPRPEWAPPADLTDNEALLGWLEERKRHPEWPQFYNSVGEWAALVAAFLGGQIGVKAIAEAIASVHNEKARLALHRYVVDRAVEQGQEIDAVELIRAINAAPTAGSAPAVTAEPQEPAGPAE